MIKIAIVDDDSLWVESLARFINGQAIFSCVLEANSLGAFFEMLTPDTDIDILLLDISLGAQNSLQHLDKIKKLLPNSKIIVMTGHESVDFLIQALQEGANSYYLKSSSPAQLINTITATQEGGVFLDPKAALGLGEIFQKGKQSEGLAIFQAEWIKEYWKLTRRELEVASGLFFEKTYKEIAQENNISLDTVRHYIKNLYKKMEVHNKAELTKKLTRVRTAS